MLTVSQLFIYPVKSLGGISLDTATLTDRGFMYDRRWMLVDENNRFLSQRELPQMALLKCSIEKEILTITHSITKEAFAFGVQENNGKKCIATVWDDSCEVVEVSAEANAWFSEILGVHCRLVFMPDDSHRSVEEKYNRNNDITSLSDAYPLLIIGQTSLDDLNERLEEKLPIDRFRPNIVFTGGQAYQEDDMHHFRIGDIDFFGVKPCARCPVTTTNQQTAERAKEPLKTLATYRMRNNNVYFGQNLLLRGTGRVQVGDEIVLL